MLGTSIYKVVLHSFHEESLIRICNSNIDLYRSTDLLLILSLEVDSGLVTAYKCSSIFNMMLDVEYSLDRYPYGRCSTEVVAFKHVMRTKMGRVLLLY